MESERKPVDPRRTMSLATRPNRPTIRATSDSTEMLPIMSEAVVAAVENLEVGIIFADKNCRVAAINVMAREILGLTKSESTSGRATDIVALIGSRFKTLDGRSLQIDRGLSLPPTRCELVGTATEISYALVSVTINLNPRDFIGVTVTIVPTTEIERQVTTDQLTGLPNRRFYDAAMCREWKRHRRGEFAHLAIAVVDLDHFKKVNDTYGHEVGDRVLKIAARAMAKAVRAGDFVARYGGEEFVVVMPNTDGEGALIMAERLRRAVAKCEITVITDAGRVTYRPSVSVGVATSRQQSLVPRRSSEAPGETEAGIIALFDRADEAVYRAKRHGRNRVVLVDEKV